MLWAEWGGVGEGSGVRRGPWRAVSTVGPLSDVRALSMGDGHQGQGQLQEAVGSWDLTQVRGDHRTWEKSCWYFDMDCIESIDQLEKI